MIQTGHKANISLAFGLTVIAGASTLLGGAAFFTKKFVHLANPRNLAVALSVSSGVMICISLMELQIEGIHTIMNSIGTVEEEHSEDAIAHEKHDDQHHIHGLNRNLLCDKTCEGKAYIICAFSFGVGCVLIFLLKVLVAKLCPAVSNNIQVEDLEEIRNNTRESFENTPSSENDLESLHNVSPISAVYLEEQLTPTCNRKFDTAKKLEFQRTSLLTALFLGFNNIPNGFAIYLATVSDIHLGIVLTVAIVLYNVPEGICIATPIYYSTGDRMKSFMWTLPIAFASPIGGVVAFAILETKRGSVIEGVMFAIVAGMMVTNSIQELLPTARRFAPNKNYVTFSFMFGVISIMIIISGFVYAGI